MPPAQFIANAFGTFIGGNRAQHRFEIPAEVKAGDLLIAIVAGDYDADVDASSAEDWEQLDNDTVGNGTITIARHLLTEDDPATLDLIMSGSNTWAGALLMAYRGLDPFSPLVGGSAVNVVTLTTFSCPARTLTRYSDLYMGVVIVTSADVDVTPPANTVERYDAQFETTKRFHVWDRLRETPGSTTIHQATTAAARSGIAASYAFSAEGLRADGKTLSNIAPVPGMIGLSGIGV